MIDKVTPKIKPFYKMQTIKGGSRIEVRNPTIPTGKMLPILPAWGAGLGRHIRIDEVNGYGNIFIINKTEFSPIQDESGNLKGSVIGLVRSYAESHKPLFKEDRVVNLGREAFGILDRRQKISSTIEIARSSDPSKRSSELRVIERKMLTKGLSEDRSAYIYNISPAGAREIKQRIPDMEWITDVRINQDRTVTVTFEHARYNEAANSDIKVTDSITLDGSAFIDNHGRELLNNRQYEVYKLSDIYQSEFYTDETRPFRPRIDFFRNNLRLILHKVSERTLDMPADLKDVKGDIKIFPSTAGAAVKIDGKWYPTEAEEPLKERHIKMIDAGPEGFSRTEKGHIQHAVGLQNRLGGKNEEPIVERIKRKGPIGFFKAIGNISSEYVRDFYFYGLLSRAVHAVRVKYGTYFGLNRAKAIRTEGAGAIESGRGELFPSHMLYDLLFVDIMNTANKSYKKLSNFGRGLWPPGVSEDTQFEIEKRLLGIRFWVIRLGNKLSGTNIMTAEKNLDNYARQNEERYVLSKVLFKTFMRVAAADIFLGRVLGIRPVMLSIPAIWEGTAGATWYDVVFSKAAESLGTPSFLGTLAYVALLPVDLVLFGIGLSFLVALEGANYLHHLWSLGFGVKTGFLQNPAMDLVFEGGTLDANVKMDQKKSQFAAFKMTSTIGGEKKVRRNAKIGIAAIAGVTGLGLYGGAAAALLGGLSQFAFWLGLGAVINIAFAAYMSVQLVASAYYANKYIKTKVAQQTANYMKSHNQDYKNFSNILDEISKRGPALTYKDLFNRRAQMASILMSEPIHMLRRNGDVISDLGSEYFDIGNQMLALYSNIEMFLVLKAGRDLSVNEKDQTASGALETILYNTTQPMVIDYGGLIWRGLQAKKKQGRRT